MSQYIIIYGTENRLANDVSCGYPCVQVWMTLADVILRNDLSIYTIRSCLY